MYTKQDRIKNGKKGMDERWGLPVISGFHIKKINGVPQVTFKYLGKKREFSFDDAFDFIRGEMESKLK